jgi:hypothetical protein
MLRQARSGGRGGGAPHRDRKRPGQVAEIDGQPPFVAGEDRIIDIDFGRLPSEAMGELWPG